MRILTVALIFSLIVGCSYAQAPRSEISDRARHALMVDNGHSRPRPEPISPRVKLMWIPEHLNSKGDTVQSHYQYFKVLNSACSTADAYELEQSLKD
jgi:hypothetical protein